MELKINEKKCLKQKLSLAEVLMSLAIRNSKDIKDVMKNLIARGILVKVDGKYKVSEEWNKIIDSIINDPNAKVIKTDEELIALATKIQECFPKQKMRDRFGKETNFYYRCNKTEVKNSLKRFFDNSTYRNATDEEILDATKRYVASFRGDYNGKMRLAKYFIWKNDVKPKGDGTGYVDPLSDLETFLENKESEDMVVTNSDDWLVTIRN